MITCHIRHALSLLLLVAIPAYAQHPQSTIPGVTKELYESVSRRPNGSFDWARFRRIMAPDATIRPQIRLTDSTDRVMSPDIFVTWIDSIWKNTIGTPRDRGFFERETNIVIEQYGDVAHAFSTYAKGPDTPREVIWHGINSIQFVRRKGLWYISAITWDEENVSGPLPPKYKGK